MTISIYNRLFGSWDLKNILIKCDHHCNFSQRPGISFVLIVCVSGIIVGAIAIPLDWTFKEVNFGCCGYEVNAGIILAILLRPGIRKVVVI